MASLFVTRNDAARRRAFSNGGLGGFVTIGSIRVMETSQGDGKATWPKNGRRRKNKPPPISIIQDSDKYFVKQEVLSPTPISDEKCTLSPRTPISRYNALMTQSSVYGNHLPPPQPPLTPKHQLLPSALELPGSLLLPSQGFPQSDPPCTPARTLLCPSRSSSEESDQIWTPAISTSSATDIEDDEMPKPFPPKHLPRVAKASKSRNFTAPASQERIGKPISAMSAEELLEELPQIGSDAVKAIWIPAMIKQHDRIKKLLQDAADVRLDTSSDIHDFDQVRLSHACHPFNADITAQTLESLSRDAHKISHNYEKAVKSAESLVERDAKACRDRLESTQNNLQAALTTIDNNQKSLRQKDDIVQQLRYTLEDIVRVLGDFIQNHTPLLVLQNIEQEDVRDVMQMLADYSNAPIKDDESTGRFVRVPEQHYMASIDALREAQLKTEHFREIAISQDQMISQQSSQLDVKLADYEKSMGVIAERNHEVRLLADDNNRLRRMVEEFETGLRVSNSTRAVQDQLFRDQEAMQSMLTNMQASHVQDLTHRDTVIADLGNRLGTAKVEVLRGKADVKNVITHTQALLSPVEQPDDYELPLTLKERRFLSKGKGKSTGLPASQSMLFISHNGQKSHAPKIPERRQSANALAKPFQQPKYAMLPRDVTPQWGCGVSQKESSQDLRDLSNLSPNYAPRLRKDSLPRTNDQQCPANGDQAMASAVVNHMLGAPIKFDPNKRLPSRPEPHYALELYGGDNATTMDQVEDSYQQQHPEPPQQVPCPRIVTQRKRVLSQITERSGEDSASGEEKAEENDTASATGSALEEYRNGLSAMRMRDYIVQEGIITSPNGKQRAGEDLPDYEGSDYYTPEDLGLVEGDTAIAKNVELVQSPVKLSPRHAKVYQTTSQDGSSSTITKKSSPLRDVEGIRVLGDPWLSGSPARI
jgi:hypothetical protein